MTLGYGSIFLETGGELAQPLVGEVRRLLLAHLEDHYDLYGEHVGVLTARKHIGWYVRSLPGGEAFRSEMNQLSDVSSQVRAVADFFDALGAVMDRLPVPAASAATPDTEPPPRGSPVPLHRPGGTDIFLETP